MTIRFLDPRAEQAYDEAQEKYREQINKRMENPGDVSPWPVFPKAPEPFADSQDKEAAKISGLDGGGLAVPLSGGYRYGSSKDPCNSPDAIDKDGNAQSTPLGFGVVNPNPFKLG